MVGIKEFTSTLLTGVTIFLGFSLATAFAVYKEIAQGSSKKVIPAKKDTTQKTPSKFFNNNTLFKVLVMLTIVCILSIIVVGLLISIHGFINKSEPFKYNTLINCLMIYSWILFISAMILTCLIYIFLCVNAYTSFIKPQKTMTE